MKDNARKTRQKLLINLDLKFIFVVLGLVTLMGCDSQPQAKSQTSDKIPTNSTNVSLQKQNTKTVDVKIASLDSLNSQRQFIGTAQPQQEVSWRSQTEAKLLELSVKVGDQVSQGQVIGKLDDRLLATTVAGTKAELQTLESELAQAKIQVKNAQIGLEEAKIQLAQARNDAERYQELAKTGLIANQQAESFATAAKVAQKGVFTAQEAINIEQQAVAIVQGRIAAQKSVLAESQQRQTYSQIVAPISGVVTAKASEPGSLILSGEQVVTIGNFSQIKIVVPLSELDLGQVGIGQKVSVRFDAFGDRLFSGQVSRIAPTTSNSTSRQIPVEVTVNNPQNQIKGGLLARVNFLSREQMGVVVPKSAIIEENGANYIFTIAEKIDNNQGIVTKRKVSTGDRSNGKVEITAGISPGERYVIRSSKPLQDQEQVGLSIISP